MSLSTAILLSVPMHACKGVFILLKRGAYEYIDEAEFSLCRYRAVLLLYPIFYPPQKSQLHLNAVLPSGERILQMQLLRRRKDAEAFSSRLREGCNDEFHGQAEELNCASNAFVLINYPSA